MSVSSKGICIVISVCVKGCIKSPCGNSILRVQTLMPIFGIATLLIEIVTVFVSYVDQPKNMICDIQEMYILYWKQGHQMIIDFHLI